MQHENHIQQFARQIAMRIAVDTRERNPRVEHALRRRNNIVVSRARLPIGDYQIKNSLIVERKTLADFALSVRDGRLFTQVARLTRQQRMRACLILEGTPDRYPYLAIPQPAFQGAVIAVTVIWGLPVLRSATPEETADLIFYAANQLQRREVRPPSRRGFRITGNTRHQLLLLQAIPEIGPKKAQWLLNGFGTPADVAAATIERIATVNGIGPNTAKKVYNVFHGTK
jgi:DNA excision repair protein ERCC-4